MVVKPRRGTASAGVAVLPDAAAAMRWKTEAEGEFVCQPFVDLPIVHLDGYFDGQDAPLLRAARYIKDCLAYEALCPRGSVEADQASTVLAEAMNLIGARYEPPPDVADPLITATARL